MEHQDWKQVIFTKTLNENSIKQNSIKQTINIMPGTGKKIIDENDIQKMETVGINIGKQIQTSRCNNKISQKELANKMNMSIQIIQQHENGKAIRNNATLSKFEQILKTKFNR